MESVIQQSHAYRGCVQDCPKKSTLCETTLFETTKETILFVVLKTTLGRIFTDIQYALFEE